MLKPVSWERTEQIRYMCNSVMCKWKCWVHQYKKLNHTVESWRMEIWWNKQAILNLIWPQASDSNLRNGRVKRFLCSGKEAMLAYWGRILGTCVQIHIRILPQLLAQEVHAVLSVVEAGGLKWQFLKRVSLSAKMRSSWLPSCLSEKSLVVLAPLD